MGLVQNLFDNDKKMLKRYNKIADEVDALKEEIEALSDEDLKAKTQEFKSRVADGETLDDLMVEAFAVIREAAKRVLGLFPFRVQLMGGMALHGGNIAEMRTGEGKP